MLALACSATPAAHAHDGTADGAADAFGTRIGHESIGLYSESLVRGFDLHQAGNYRIEGSYFARAATPPDTIVEGSRILVGPTALPVRFPAPSGIVQYRLLRADEDRARVELGFQHLLDANPRPYLRAHFAHGGDGGPLTVAGGVLGSPSARYMFGNEARYHGVGLVPRLAIGDDWQLATFYGHYAQAYEADIGFQPAGARMPRPDRLRYLGQPWSRYDTRNTTYGAILSSGARGNQWDLSLSGIHSRTEKPRTDFNIFSDVTEDGMALASVSVARDRAAFQRAFEVLATRDWSSGDRRDELTLLVRARGSDHRNPRIDLVRLGRVSLSGPVPHAAEPDDVPRRQATFAVDQRELGLGWQRQWRNGASVDVGLRRAVLEESALAADGTASSATRHAWLHDASLVVPVTARSTAFLSTVRGIEEAGVAPQHAVNAYEVLAPSMARQSEAGLEWSGGGGLTLVGTAFDIRKPEPGFAPEGRYRYVGMAHHRGIELSVSGEVQPGLTLLGGGSWIRPCLRDETDDGTAGDRPVGRPDRVLMVGLAFSPPALERWAFDADASYIGSRPVDARDSVRTPGYAVLNLGLRYRFRLHGAPATVRLRVHNATDRYAWSVDAGGMQAWEPERRVMLSLALGR